LATELYRGARSYRENLTHFLGQGSFVVGYRPELERSRSGECALSGADRVRTRRTRTLYASHRNVGKIRHKGLLFSIELVEDKMSRQPHTRTPEEPGSTAASHDRQFAAELERRLSVIEAPSSEDPARENLPALDYLLLLALVVITTIVAYVWGY
jgi:hypothetical protein